MRCTWTARFRVSTRPSCAARIATRSWGRCSPSRAERELHEGLMRLSGPQDAAGKILVIGRIGEILGLEADGVPARIDGPEVVRAIHLQSRQVGTDAHAYAARRRMQLRDRLAILRCRRPVEHPAMIESAGERNLRMRRRWWHPQTSEAPEIEGSARHRRDLARGDARVIDG